jgi:cell division protein FtsW (lipid II flippase)
MARHSPLLGGLLSLLMNMAMLVFLFVSPLIKTNWFNLIITLTLAFCGFLVRTTSSVAAQLRVRPHSRDAQQTSSLSLSLCVCVCVAQVVVMRVRYRRWEAEVAIYHGGKPRPLQPAPHAAGLLIQ